MGSKLGLTVVGPQQNITTKEKKHQVIEGIVFYNIL